MSNKFIALSSALLLLTVVACKKSNNSGGNSGSNPLTGNWNFVSITSNAKVSASETLGPFTTQIVEITDFTTKNNAGAFTFTADSVATVGLGYTIDTTYTAITTVGGVSDTTVTPFTTTVTPASSTAAYQLVGQDSIYFPGSTPFSVGVSNGPTVKINGAHYAISGNTLTLTSTINQTANETFNGITAPATTTAKSTIILTKQ
jgi:hypothetical protein